MSAVQPSYREHAAAIFRAGVAAADPYLAVKRFLRADSGLLHIGSEQTGYRSGDWRRIHLISFGKAACAMADAAQTIIPEAWLAAKGIVVTNYDNIDVVENCQVFGAGHPLPDAAGLHAAKTIATRLSDTNPGELVLVLISGGGSALLPYPVAGINLADKIATTRLLLASGATINQINCVRKHLSQLKGGGLARLAAPADLHALILSDVLDNDLSAIASGPTVPDDTTFTDAVAVLESFGIWQKIPSSVQNYLQQGAQGLQIETPKGSDPLFRQTSHHLLGSNAISVDAAIDKARELGYETQLYSKQLSGEARLVAEQIALHALSAAAGMTRPTAVIAGGETTVTLKGNGKGGRNQEMALAFALAAEKYGLNGAWTFLSGGTDGRDGPTDAAGGIVDDGTLPRIRAAGLDPAALLDDNDSYPALQAANDLLLSGATGTNVADLQILLLHPNE
ncbi:glycerate kinase [Methylomonas sp. EFPC1]|uniref:glycerate kinase type-2 family protein n=1 Tax=Methylomonas sp. EFPC1 TaxID=2812647 RepID=UPI0019670512|nr:glycerate kinase [Methylomonas sp. EFPC1]QSB02902.1 glycerate kinase [Methylomonas sp. EFPC1]